MELGKLDENLLGAARQLPPSDSSPGHKSTPTQKQTNSPRPTDGRSATPYPWGLPESRHDNTFESWVPVAAMNEPVFACRAVADGREWCALLTGGTGNGKTHLAVAALLRWYDEHHMGMFWKVPKFLPFLRAFIFDKDSIGFEQIMENYGAGPSLLVLDDLGAHKASEWADETMYRIIDDRYENQAPTIITANVPVESIDPRIVSRMRSGLVICAAPDYRAKQSKEA